MATGTVTLSRLAALAVVSIATLPSLCSAAGGSIFFTGELVAASYDVAVRPPGTGPAGNSVRTVSPQVVEIAFPSGGGDRKSSSVSVVGLNGMPLEVRCPGTGALRAASWPAAGCHLGPTGGTLTISTQDDPRAGATRGAIVTVAYD
ncbi:MAG: hypothetical protein J7605_28450 [Variovorax sp.]|nr:hypothetical protein [Variovorax sp.]